MADLPARRIAKVPPGCRYYVVGDIHGRFDLLEAVVQRVEADMVARSPATCFEVYLGDYVDRGPGSAAVLEFLIQRQLRGNLVCLAGNHERMMASALENDEAFAHWCRFGGLDTLASYGLSSIVQRESLRQLRVKAVQKIPEHHQKFLAMLPLYHIAGDYLFVHAGLRPNVPLAEQTREDLTTIREPFLSSTESLGFVIVHGHTPKTEMSVEHFRINIDTGAFATGNLTVIALESDTIWQV